MNKLTAKREFRFSIIILFFGIFLLITTFFFPWISFHDEMDGQNVFHLNYEMMQGSTYPDIKIIADNLCLIIFMLWSTIIFGLLSILSITYHIATKKSDIGFYLSFLINLFMIILAFLIVNRYFSIIDYINEVDIIYLSSPFPYFSYTFISLIGSIVFLSITGIYGGFITIMILKDFKDMGLFCRRKNRIHAIGQQINDSQTDLNINLSENISGLYNVSENRNGLAAKPIRENEEKEIKFLEKIEKKTARPFSFGESDEDVKEDDKKKEEDTSELEEKREAKPFSFKDIEKKSKNNNRDNQISNSFSSKDSNDKTMDDVNDELSEKSQSSPENDNLEIKEQQDVPINDNTLDSKQEIFKPEEKRQSPNKNQDINADVSSENEEKIEKKIKTVICPQCKQIFSVEKTGDKTIIKCPNCGKEGNIG